jgi:hypothetical protein
MEELLELAMNPDVLVHQQVHNQLLRQLVDASLLSSDPRMPVFKPSYEIEVDFHE